MTHGIYVNGLRPKTKKAIKEAIASGCDIELESTSMFGDEYNGPVSMAPDGTYIFVGPDPYQKRYFFGTLKIKGDKVTLK